MDEVYEKAADMVYDKGILKGTPIFYKDDWRIIGEALWRIVMKTNFDFQGIAGISYMGHPIIGALEKIVPKPRGFKVFKLSEKGSRIIISQSPKYRNGEVVLLFSGIIKEGIWELKKIKKIEAEGISVKDLIVLFDRQYRARKLFEEAGYNLVSCFNEQELLNYCYGKNKINNGDYWLAVDRLEKRRNSFFLKG